MFSRIPKLHDRIRDRAAAWEYDDDGDLRPSESSLLLLDEAFEITGNFAGLTPRLSFNSDSFWDLDGDGNLQPKSS